MIRSLGVPTQRAGEIDQLFTQSWQPISLRKALCKEAYQ